MKKITYIVILGALVVVMGFSCPGCPGNVPSSYYDTYPNSSLITSNNQEVELKKIDEVLDQLIGLWRAENRKTNTYSQLHFNEDGTFQEDIYRQLNREFKASIKGSYSTDNGQLTIILTNAEQYKFEYHLKTNRLKLSPIAENN